MNCYINRADLEQYVYDTLPWDEVSDWDIPAIADGMIAAWPDLIGNHPDMPLDAINEPRSWITNHIDGDIYWSMVARHQTVTTTTEGENE